jgi:hypothetical protein
MHPPAARGTGWREIYLGGSPAAEARLIESFAEQIGRVQADVKEREHAPTIRRAFHAKIHAGITNAEFRVLPDLPPDLQVGYFQPGAAYPATVRFSNASGAMQPDGKRDLRGLAVRIVAGDGEAAALVIRKSCASPSPAMTRTASPRKSRLPSGWIAPEALEKRTVAG